MKTDLERIQEILSTLSLQEKDSPAWKGLLWGINSLIDAFGERISISGVRKLLLFILEEENTIRYYLDTQQPFETISSMSHRTHIAIYKHAFEAYKQANSNQISLEQAQELVTKVAAAAKAFQLRIM